MTFNLTQMISAFSLVILLTACSGGGGGDSESGPELNADSRTGNALFWDDDQTFWDQSDWQ